jgi:hypothetical protein
MEMQLSHRFYDPVFAYVNGGHSDTTRIDKNMGQEVYLQFTIKTGKNNMFYMPSVYV